MSYQKLFNHMSQEHGLTLLEGEMTEIMNIVRKMDTDADSRVNGKAAIKLLKSIADKVIDLRVVAYRARVAEGDLYCVEMAIYKAMEEIERVNLKWVASDDVFPDNDKDVVVYNENTGAVTFAVFYDGEFWKNSEMIGVTHWMPLPSGPEEKR